MRRLFRAAATLLVLASCAAGATWGRTPCGSALIAAGIVRQGAAVAGDSGWLGFALAREGRYQEAVAAFGSALSAAYDRGNAMMLSGWYEDAVLAYEDALRFDPDDEDARHNEAIAKSILAMAA